MLKKIFPSHTLFFLCTVELHIDTQNCLFRTTNKNTFIFSLDGYNANFVYLDLYSNHQALQGDYKKCFVKSLKQNLFFILK